MSIDKFFDIVPLHRNHPATTEQLQLQRAATEQLQLWRGQSHQDASSRCRSTALIDTPFGHAPSTRCVSFLTSTLMAFPTLAILSCVVYFSLVPLPSVLPSCLFINHGPSQLLCCQNRRSQGLCHQGQDLCQEDRSQVQSCQTRP